MAQTRRQILKTGLAGVAALGGGAAAALAQTDGRARSGASPAVVAERMKGPLFYDAETTSGLSCRNSFVHARTISHLFLVNRMSDFVACNSHNSLTPSISPAAESRFSGHACSHITQWRTL